MSTEVSSNASCQPGQSGKAAASKSSAPEKMSRESVTIIATLLVATFVVILNETIMNVALQRLMVDLGVDAPTVQWLSTGFMLTMAVVTSSSTSDQSHPTRPQCTDMIATIQETA